MKDLSIIIVTYNSAEDIIPCLFSIEERSGGVDKEVIVVDNASSDGTALLVEERFPHVTVVRNDFNKGFAAAINQGAGAAGGRYLFLINPDSILKDDGLSRALTFLDGNGRVGAAGCRIINPDGTIQLSCRSFPSYGTIFFSRYSIMSRLFPNNRFSRRFLLSNRDHGAPMAVDWVSGAAMLLRKTALDDAGGFDEAYFLFIEDIDLCWRLRRKGWQVCYIPYPTVLHHIGKSSEKIRLKSIYYHHRSIYLFYSKHYRRPAANALLGVGLFARAIFLMASCSLFGGGKKC